jgi:diguanylate cyclase (GGDEF)-like protein/PAS domain S-box-containing protein
VTPHHESRDARRRLSALTALLAFALGAICWLTGLLSPLDRAFLDLQTRWLQHRVDSDVVIVEIDEHSLHELGTWPWRRARHAELIEKLQRLGARRLFVDIDFSAPSTHPEDDQRLAATLRHATGLIILPAFWQPLSLQSAAFMLSQPLPELLDNPNVRQGSVNLLPGPDGLIRDIPEIVLTESQPVPPVWKLLLQTAKPLGTASLPLDYRIAPTSFTHFSYVDLLQGRAKPDLRGKTVLIGATALELGDIVAVPVHRALAGILVQALSYESARRAPTLYTGPGALIPILLLWAFVCAFLLTSVRWRKPRGVAAMLLVAPLAGKVIAYTAANVIVACLPFFATSVTTVAVALLRSLNIETLRSWRASLRLRHQDVLLRRIVDTSPDGILTLDDAGTVRNGNNAAAIILGRPLADLVGQSCQALLPPLKAQIAGLSELNAAATAVLELSRANGTGFPAEVVMTRLAWEDSFVVSVCIRDVSAQKKREQELHYVATHDGLTGLPNRRLLAERLRLALDGAHESEAFALLLVDLDGFKQVNDTFGHGMGDELLVELGKRLQGLDSEFRCVARVGADEFALLLTETQTKTLAKVCKDVRSLAEMPITIHEVPISLGARIGVSLYPEHGQDSDLLLHRADIALYSAKRKGATVEIYNSSLDVRNPRRLQMLTELRTAAAKQQLTLHFQPKVSMATSAPVEAEALCRWRSPVFGDVSPGEFIVLAEASELIQPLTRWTLQHAIECCQRWRNKGCELKVAVNLSARHLQDEQLPVWLTDLLHRTGTQPSWLELEITESAIMADTERALGTLRAIRQLGITLSIDDYGTGYSSLAYLQKLAVNRLKIDKSFVAGLGHSRQDELIVKSTIDLAHGLGLEVVAEGIETQAQFSELQAMGCDYGQGYFIAHAMPEDLLFQWYASHRVDQNEAQSLGTRRTLSLV